MLVIGLTGGMGSGKSTVSRLLMEKGARMVDGDKVGHQLYEPGGPAYSEVVATFGPGVVGPDGQIDRARLGSIVFADPDALKRLNAIMHPKIKDVIAEVLQGWRRDGAEVAVVEAAVLFEAKWADLVDEVWVTLSDEGTVVDRLSKAKGMSPEQVRARLRSQMPAEEKARRAHVVIRNDDSLEGLEKQVEALWHSVNSRLKGSGSSSPAAPD
ncbi:MAG: dephospho-CoA kinase [Dehalococcoidia bacterium]